MRSCLRLTIGSLTAITLLASAVPGQAQLLMGALLVRRLNKEDRAREAPPAPPKRTIPYGTDPLQNLDLTLPNGVKGPVPLVLFVHGGAWTQGNKDNATGNWKAPHYTAQGYAFASISYRLVPAVRVEDEAADVAAALARLIADADKLGIDRHRIVLMGHSAGAHLVALVGTDERYLQGSGLSFGDLAGVLPIDGAAYDVPAQMAAAGSYMQGRYKQAFGTDVARQRAVSPLSYAAAPNAARFLFINVQREDGLAQAKALADALRQAGAAVQTNQFEGKGLRGHVEINRKLGDPDYPATPVVDVWLKDVFAQSLTASPATNR